MLKELTEAAGVSGQEKEVRDIIKKAVEKHADRTFEDDFGNLFVIKGKKGKKIMLLAHTDEVGFMIIGIDRNGLLKFQTVGGIDQRVLPGKFLLVGQDKIPGVIGHKPVHLAKNEELTRVVSVDSMFIDIGAKSKEDAEKQVKIGDYAVFNTKFEEKGKIIMGKAFDDRLGCYVLLEILKQDFDAQIIGVFTVQEELGLKGAKIAGFRMKPDVAIAVEVTSTNDMPTDKDVNRAPVLNGGPVITIADQTIICDRQLVDIFTRTAKKKNIPYQMKPPMIGGTDAGIVQRQRGGIRAAVIANPARYIHSPCSIASRSDLRYMSKLLSATIEKIIQEVK